MMEFGYCLSQDSLYRAQFRRCYVPKLLVHIWSLGFRKKVFAKRLKFDF